MDMASSSVVEQSTTSSTFMPCLRRKNRWETSLRRPACPGLRLTALRLTAIVAWGAAAGLAASHTLAVTGRPDFGSSSEYGRRGLLAFGTAAPPMSSYCHARWSSPREVARPRAVPRGMSREAGAKDGGRSNLESLSRRGSAWGGTVRHLLDNAGSDLEGPRMTRNGDARGGWGNHATGRQKTFAGTRDVVPAWLGSSRADSRGGDHLRGQGGDGVGSSGGGWFGGSGGGGERAGGRSDGRSRRGDGYGHGTGLNCTAAPNALLLSANSASGPSSRDGGSFELDAGFEVDKTLMKRSPLVRTFVPILDFFKSRAGLYGLMVAYVMVTLSQHITPAFVGMSFLTLMGPGPSRRFLVAFTQGLSVLTVASYVQDQFRNQVYPLPALVAGPEAPYAVVTGGSSGIGREIANELAARGYNLLLVARNKDALKRAAKEIRRASREAAERARREGEAGAQYPSTLETRRGRRRRLRRERKEKEMRRQVDRRSADNEEADEEHDTGTDGDDMSDQPPHTGASQDAAAREQERKWAGLVQSQAHLPAPHYAEPVRVRYLQADLSNASACAALHDEVSRLNMTVEILVNAAGVCRAGRVEHSTSEDMEEQIQLNVLGTSLLTRLFSRDLVQRKRGRIMIVSSITAAAPNPRVATYAATKSYLTSFAQALHSELEGSGVGVTCVMPGATVTNFGENSGSKKALVWRLPFVTMEADEVAARGVEGMMRGDRLVVTGWQNKLFTHVLAPLIREAISRVEFLEGRVRLQVEDLTSLGSSGKRMEGSIAVLRDKQDHLDFQASDVRNKLGLMERKLAWTESALSGTISHAQLTAGVGSALGAFRQEIEERVSSLERTFTEKAKEVSRRRSEDGVEQQLATEVILRKMEEVEALGKRRHGAEQESIRDLVQQAIGLLRAEVSSKMRDASDLTERRLEAAFARIREETEANAGTLRVLVAKVSRRDVEDEEVGETARKMQRMVDDIEHTAARDCGRTRRELEDLEARMQRKNEEMCASFNRRMGELAEELRREHGAMIQHGDETSKKCSEIRSIMSSLESGQRDNDGRIHRLELVWSKRRGKYVSGTPEISSANDTRPSRCVRMIAVVSRKSSAASTVETLMKTRGILVSMETKMGSLQQQIEGIHEAAERMAGSVHLNSAFAAPPNTPPEGRDAKRTRSSWSPSPLSASTGPLPSATVADSSCVPSPSPLPLPSNWRGGGEEESTCLVSADDVSRQVAGHRRHVVALSTLEYAPADAPAEDKPKRSLAIGVETRREGSEPADLRNVSRVPGEGRRLLEGVIHMSQEAEPKERFQPSEADLQPAEGVERTEKGTWKEDVQGTQEADGTEEVESTEEVEPTEKIEPIKDFEPTEEVESTAGVVEPTEEVEPTKEVELTKEVEPTKEDEPTNDVEPTNEVEPTKEVEGTKDNDDSEGRRAHRYRVTAEHPSGEHVVGNESAAAGDREPNSYAGKSKQATGDLPRCGTMQQAEGETSSGPGADVTGRVHQTSETRDCSPEDDSRDARSNGPPGCTDQSGMAVEQSRTKSISMAPNSLAPHVHLSGRGEANEAKSVGGGSGASGDDHDTEIESAISEADGGSENDVHVRDPPITQGACSLSAVEETPRRYFTQSDAHVDEPDQGNETSPKDVTSSHKIATSVRVPLASSDPPGSGTRSGARIGQRLYLEEGGKHGSDGSPRSSPPDSPGALPAPTSAVGPTSGTRVNSTTPAPKDEPHDDDSNNSSNSSRKGLPERVLDRGTSANASGEEDKVSRKASTAAAAAAAAAAATVSTRPTPVRNGDRALSKDSGVATAQCEFCLRRYLTSAMSSHIEVCELRLVRCPFQCGVRVLVRNLAKHKKTCALRHGSSDEDDDPQDSGSESPRLLSVRSSRVNDVGSAHRTARAGVGNASYLSPNERRSLPPPPSRPSDRARMGDPMQKGRLLDGDESPADMADLDRSGESPRMVTCMRCHESVPFYLVPSHGANCKGSGPDEGPADFERGLLPPGPPPFSRDPSSSCFSSSSLHVKTKTTGRPSAGTPSSLRAHPSPLMTPRLQNEEMDMFGTSFSSPHDPLIRSRAFSERGDFPACLSAISTTGASPFDTRTAGFKSAGESMISDGDIGAMDIHRSSGGSQRVRFWSTSQVTSWLRMSLGPGPAASRVISRFEEAGIDGASLLELTERDLLHPTDGLGITDVQVRRQILEAVDDLLD